jgi:hypothetical protein
VNPKERDKSETKDQNIITHKQNENRLGVDDQHFILERRQESGEQEADGWSKE